MYWDEGVYGWSFEPGEFKFAVGSSSEDIRLNQVIDVK